MSSGELPAHSRGLTSSWDVGSGFPPNTHGTPDLKFMASSFGLWAELYLGGWPFFPSSQAQENGLRGAGTQQPGPDSTQQAESHVDNSVKREQSARPCQVQVVINTCNLWAWPGCWAEARSRQPPPLPQPVALPSSASPPVPGIRPETRGPTCSIHFLAGTTGC